MKLLPSPSNRKYRKLFNLSLLEATKTQESNKPFLTISSKLLQDFILDKS
jgi:hypothetical protein